MKANLILFFCSLVILTSLKAQIPRTISYQGVLTDSEGEVLPDGNYTISIRFYEDAFGGDALWNEDINIELEGGIFGVIIGQIKDLDLAFDKQYWIGIAVDNGDELAPRTALTASPYSLGGVATEIDLNPGTPIAIKDELG
jgi:hypothetical protein